MKQRFRLVKRGARGSTFYVFDTIKKTRLSLKTQDEEQAVRVVNAKNEASKTAAMNLQLARVYIQQSDPAAAARTWQEVMSKYAGRSGKQSTRDRKLRAMDGKQFDKLRRQRLLETTSDHLRAVIKIGGAYTNHFLHCLHNLAQGHRYGRLQCSGIF
jgi:hypothetical protein